MNDGLINHDFQLAEFTMRTYRFAIKLGDAYLMIRVENGQSQRFCSVVRR